MDLVRIQHMELWLDATLTAVALRMTLAQPRRLLFPAQMRMWRGAGRGLITQSLPSTCSMQ